MGLSTHTAITEGKARTGRLHGKRGGQDLYRHEETIPHQPVLEKSNLILTKKRRIEIEGVGGRQGKKNGPAYL